MFLLSQDTKWPLDGITALAEKAPEAPTYRNWLSLGAIL